MIRIGICNRKLTVSPITSEPNKNAKSEIPHVSFQRKMTINCVNEIGIENIKKRLEIMYAEKHELEIIDENKTFNVALKVVLGNSKRK